MIIAEILNPGNDIAESKGLSGGAGTGSRALSAIVDNALIN